MGVSLKGLALCSAIACALVVFRGTWGASNIVFSKDCVERKFRERIKLKLGRKLIEVVCTYMTLHIWSNWKIIVPAIREKNSLFRNKILPNLSEI